MRNKPHKWYSVWNAMIGRCYRPSQKSYKDYGERGISVCDEWRKDPELFFQWLDENLYSKGLQIDRIDNNRSYHPDNCRIVTHKENCNNRRDTKKYSVGEEELTIAQIADKTGIKYATLYKRIKGMGMSAESALKMNLWQRVRPVGRA